MTGACDKTLRQWDLATGQCVMTMDLLWAISHPSTLPTGHMPGFPVVGAAAAAGAFAVPTPPYADGSWELYQDFIGAVQSWEYALVSGSGDGAVRMWDMRTGQAHRTLLGHTGPVTCLQFDEIHVVSGSLDKSVRVRPSFVNLGRQTRVPLSHALFLLFFYRSGTCAQAVSSRQSNMTTP